MNVTISTADGANPRTDIITCDASGNVTATAGTPTAEVGTTQNSGTGTINSGATTAVITHGLSSTPAIDDIFITLGENPTNNVGAVFVTNITSTQFTVNVENDPGASNLDFGWQAEVLGSGVLEAPMPALAADEILLAKVRVGAGVTVIGTDKVFGRAINVRNAAVSLFQPAQILNSEMVVAAGGAVLNSSAVWTTANVAIYIPFRVNRAITVRKINLNNGASAADNVDVGIYDVDANGLPRTKLVSSGSTAQSGTSAWQVFDVTDTYLAAGLYYMACAFSGNTGTVTRLIAGTAQDSRAFSIYEETSAFALPATATPAVFTTTRSVPLMSVNRGTT